MQKVSDGMPFLSCGNEMALLNGPRDRRAPLPSSGNEMALVVPSLGGALYTGGNTAVEPSPNAGGNTAVEPASWSLHKGQAGDVLSLLGEPGQSSNISRLPWVLNNKNDMNSKVKFLSFYLNDILFFFVSSTFSIIVDCKYNTDI